MLSTLVLASLTVAPAMAPPFLAAPVQETAAATGRDAALAPLAFDPGDVICLLGGALAERMQHHGWLETRLQLRFPEAELTFRNLGFAADELDVHQRTMNFGKFTADGMEMTLEHDRFVPWDRYLAHCEADKVFAFFGYNESFAGEAGLPAFREKLASFIDHVAEQRYSGEPPALVLFGIPPHEDFQSSSLPDGREHNARILAYNGALASVARDKGIRYVDLYAPMVRAYATEPGKLTMNGIHLTEGGNRVLARVIEEALFGDAAWPVTPAALADSVRAVVLEKNLLWFNRYRATDGYNVYGGRSRKVYAADATGGTFANFDVLQREMDHIDVLCANRDGRIRALARGELTEGGPIDDSNAPPLIDVLTNAPGPGGDAVHEFLEALDVPRTLRPAPGMKVELFADEQQFPDLANPVQMAWDTRGRLWVAVWPTYPHWTPGQPMNDKLLVLEDDDGDGRADTCTSFADDLHNPTGFEFWNGGVLLAAAPDLLFLEDTDGDGRADRRERLLSGLSSADTHHAANSFVLGPDGALYFQEGTFHQSQIETIHGPVRNWNGCVWRFHPRTWRVERYVPYNFANPHGHVFDRWGQDFVTDGTGNVNYYALPFSGHIEHPAKHAGYFPFFQQRSRPCAGTEILSSRHFPEANQGNYLIANVIGFQGIFQYRIEDDGSGFGAVEVDPLVESSDRNFRPADIEVGPDGAVYFLDWHNPLIGHLQHHIRDPSRDSTHGRVYRVTYGGRPTLDPPAIAGQPIAALLELLRSPEDRVRYRTRIELSGRPTDEVVAAAREWARQLDEADPGYEHHLLEALWLHQQHDRMDRELLIRLLEAEDPRARAAATRVVRYARHLLPDALELLASRVEDAHPRVRLEAVVGASFFGSKRAAEVALGALRYDTDRFLDYALAETMRALEPAWRAALRAGEPLAADNQAGIEYLLDRVDSEELSGMPRFPAVLWALATRHGVAADHRAEALRELAWETDGSVAGVLVEAIERVDRGSGAHAAHVVAELGDLLVAESTREGVGGAREALEELSRSGRLPISRGAAVAALVAVDGALEPTWSRAAASLSGLEGLLAAAPFLADSALPFEVTGDLADRVRPLMFELPAELASSPDQPGTGVRVAVHEPAPRDATRETFAGRAPTRELDAPSFTLDLDGVRDLPTFGLAFEGTLHVTEAGRYTFHLGSDDGSRLYLDGECLIDNDGDHSFATVSAERELAAGGHPILVTFFESGGDEGLKVEWEGPGFDRQPIPTSVLGGPASGERLRASAIAAMSHLPAAAEQKFGDGERLLRTGAPLGAATGLLRSVPESDRAPDVTRSLVAALAAHLADLAPEQRTEADALAALELARELAEVLPGDERSAALNALSGLGGSVIVLRTLPHQMLYDVEAFWVAAGSTVSLVFENNDVMPHNLVITVPGAMEEVGRAAEAQSQEAGAQERAFVPPSEKVLWHTGLVMPGQSERITFQAPEATGDHPYVCTYPGHWRVMNGVMHVVDEVPAQQVARREDAGHGGSADAPQRAFVREWSVADLAPRFEGEWRAQCDPARGRVLFEEAGCIKCHTVAGEGAVAGPELTAIREKYRGLDLLTHVIEPSREVLEDYVFKSFELDGGPGVIGRVLEDDGEYLHVVERLLLPDEVTLVAKDEIVEQRDTPLSPMPTGLLVTFTEDEILDLVGFLEGGGGAEDSDAPAIDESALRVEYPGGARSDHHIVLLAGDEEYRSEEGLPMLAKILSERHGFRCTVLFSTDRETLEINPDEQTWMPGIELLDEADMVVCFLRFRELSDGDMAHFVDYVESGRPLLGIRTATHAFAYGRDPESPYARYSFNSKDWPGGFGQQVLGDTWINHHGAHGSESTRGVVEAQNADHPILRGVDDVWGPTDVYGIRNLPDDARVLLRGQVLAGMEPGSPPVEGAKNDPMMPIVWVRELPHEGGGEQRVVCSTIGASVDLLSEGLRRVFVNACYFGLGLEDEIPERSDVEPVGSYEPTFFGFGKYVRGVRAQDHALTR